MAWKKNITITLTGSSDLLEGSMFFQLTFNHILSHVLDTGGAIDKDFRIDSLSSATYTYRESDNSSADVVHNGSGSGETEITLDDTSDSTERFTMGYGINIDSEEKLFIFLVVDANTTGTANVPNIIETVGKQTGTTTKYSSVSVLNTQAGSFAIDSNITGFATD